MTNKEILEKAIQKAIDNGWLGDMLDLNVEEQDDGILRIYWDNTEWSVLDIIVNHAFAKALWGGRRIKPGEQAPYGIGTKHNGIVASWEYHLQNMVIADDPIKYLGENI